MEFPDLKRLSLLIMKVWQDFRLDQEICTDIFKQKANSFASILFAKSDG